jgi:4-amino-4-deoxy-L-arabinose transferase-like glycosyltransferase
MHPASYKESSPLLMGLLLYLFSIIFTLAIFFFVFGTAHLKNLDVDEQYYYTQAQKIVDGNYILNTYRPIGFVAVLSLIIFVSQKNLIAIQILLILISCLKTPLTYLLAQRIIGHSMVGIISAIGVALWPPLVFYTISFYSETVAIPCFLTFLVFLPKGSYLSSQQKSHTVGYIFSGALLALCSLMHPIYILFIPFALLMIFFEERKFKVCLKHCGIFFTALVVTSAPWSIFASWHEGSFILLSNNSVDAIAGGLNPVLIEQGFTEVSAPDGRKTWDGPGTWIPNAYLSEEEEMLPRAKKNELLLKRTISWIFHHPWEVLYLEIAKLANMWGLYPPLVNNQPRFFLGNVPIVCMLILSILSLIKFRTDFRILCRFWLLPLFVSSAAMMSWGSWRFREPADIGLITLSSLLLFSWFFPDQHINLKQTRERL